MTGSVTAFVLDSSVALGAFFEDEQDDYSLGVWRSLPDTDALVPALWHLEMANILSRALHAGRITQAQLDDSWSRLADVGLRSLPSHGEAPFWTQRAADWGLSAYDACYLEAALTQRVPLATKDRALAEAARRIGVPLYLNHLHPTRSQGPKP